ncbi:MAG: ACT domain-containing protein [Mariniblastus sp.]
MQLRFLKASYSVCQLAADADIPSWSKGEFVAILRTDEELSVVVPTNSVPVDFTESLTEFPNVKASHDWRCFRVCSELEFDVIGVIAGISKVLKDASVSIFSLSTYNTDYFLVTESSVNIAKQALTDAGYTFEGE